MSTSSELRSRLKDALAWHAAHIDLERAVKNVDPAFRGRRVDGLPHSLWQLLDHIRIAQADILDYCVNEAYETPEWPDAFWPSEPAPPSREAWQQTIDAVRRDRRRLAGLIDDVDVESILPHDERHSYLREILLVVDHTSYHIGQMVLLRRLLGIWPP